MGKNYLTIFELVLDLSAPMHAPVKAKLKEINTLEEGFEILKEFKFTLSPFMVKRIRQLDKDGVKEAVEAKQKEKELIAKTTVRQQMVEQEIETQAKQARPAQNKNSMGVEDAL